VTGNAAAPGIRQAAPLHEAFLDELRVDVPEKASARLAGPH
jgi:hypothetical protein